MSETRPDETDDILQQAAAWRGENRGVALATVVRTWGSSPRPVGSQLAVEDGGAMVGSVSGGCIEGRLLEFDVSNEQAWDVGLACGGIVHVFVERLE
jgi:xanthine/CO dehydrogenase XdhC/CoxF family maturation factor